NNESAGKHRSGKTRRGNPWLRTALTEAALAAIRHGRGALAARYRRIMRHRGHKKAVIAVAHAMLVAIYHMLTRRTTYQDLGDDYYDRRHAERAKHRALQTLERQGYRVSLEPVHDHRGAVTGYFLSNGVDRSCQGGSWRTDAPWGEPGPSRP